MTMQAHGETTTKLRARGQDVFIEPADQLFYMVGHNTLLAVPKQQMLAMLTEMRLLEAVVEAQQNAIAHLKTLQDSYIQVKQANYFKPEGRVLIEQSEHPEVLERKIRVAQGELDSANEKLRGVLAPVSGAQDPSNPIVELIPIQRRGSHASPNGFRMAYARLKSIPAECCRYSSKLESTAPMGDDNLLTDGAVDWNKLKQQITDIANNTAIKMDVPWFDDWLEIEDQSKDLFQWSKRLNESLNLADSYQVGGDHEAGSKKVDLSAEAQLMRWGYGASGLSGELNPFQGKASIKASGHAELMLAQARGTIDCYEPPGGYMMAFAGVNLGMLRSHTLLSVGGSLGASVAIELNLQAEFTGRGAKAKGIPGSSREAGVPGQQVVDMADPEPTQGAELKAFAGGELGVTVAGQVEWKSPETDKFAPFAKIAPAVAGQAGVGAEAKLNISYRNGKFRILAKAGFCFGLGAKGKLTLEVDADLIWEFAQWVAYQLKNINYERLEFIDDEAFRALSNMLALALQSGRELKAYVYDTAEEAQNAFVSFWDDLQDDREAADARSLLVQRINTNPDVLRYTTPDAKGALLYRLIQVNAFDALAPENRTWDWEDINFWRFGFMTERKRAIINIFAWVQSQEEYRNVMQRIKPELRDDNITVKEGESMLLAFLGRGEKTWLSSDYSANLRHFYRQLKPTASKGTPIVRNDMEDYLTQYDVEPKFHRACFNRTECLAPPRTENV
jgi:hypothetical protein